MSYGVRVAINGGERVGGGFKPTEPTAKGGPDYGRFIEAVRTLQDHARAADAPDAVISEAADLVEQVSALLAPYDSDEWASPSGRRIDLLNRGNLLAVPFQVSKTDDCRVVGWARFRRFHLGRNGAVHGGAIAMLFDSILGITSSVITRGPYQRTASLHVNYRKVVPVEKELRIDAVVNRVEGRKIFVDVTLSDPEDNAVLTEGQALFVLLKAGQS